MPEETLRFFRPQGRRKCAQPNYEYFDEKGRSARFYRVRYLYEEYREACEQVGEVPCALSTFINGLSTWRRNNVKKKDLAWFPGEYVQCYWSQLDFLNNERPKPLYIFVARLPYSEFAYLRVSESPSDFNWMRFCMDAYHYFGGVPHVTEHDRAALHLEKEAQTNFRSLHWTFQAFAAHYKTVLFNPCPKTNQTAKKRLKPLVLKRYSPVLKYVRKNLIVSADMTIDELNDQAVLLANRANERHLDGGLSAREIFERFEAPQLLKLPPEDYDMSIWVERKVGKDYHFYYDNIRYSVPFSYAYKRIRVRVMQDFIEVYSLGQRIAKHKIPHKRKGKLSVTDPAHRPRKHEEYAQRLERRFMSLALEVGPATAAIMREILSICEKSGGSYRPCKDFLDLQHSPSIITLEEACSLVFEREMELSVAAVLQIMKEKG